MDPFIGQIMMVPYDFAPRGWAFCDGKLLPIMQHTALFSLLGTRFGGNGQTSFALPDLRGRVPIHVGESQGRGVSAYTLGETGGNEEVLVEPRNLGAGAESVKSSDGRELHVMTYGHTMPEPLNVRQPYAAVNFIIALDGLYPSRT